MYYLAITLCFGTVFSFPWVSNIAGVDSSLFRRSAIEARTPGDAATCPNNPKHPGAAPYTAQYPYCGASNLVPGKQSCVQNYVPASGDTAHYYVAPGSLDIRGPCPGLNTAANHNFLSHDGITTFTELVDMQQNVYGVGYDLAVLLATLGVGLDGDPVTQKLSLGCDATTRTSATGGASGTELGLDGHNKFEGDSSLTRNDYFPAGGDNYSFNRTLYNRMSAVANGNFSRNQMAAYRFARYLDSRSGNGNFYFGPKSLLLFGASSFVYELFPNKGDKGPSTQAIQDSFFVNETLPAHWQSRETPYTIPSVSQEISAQYMQYPVPFGGNTGKPNSFVGIGSNGPYFSNNMFSGNAKGVQCLLYQFATENQPSSLQGSSNIPQANFIWAAGKLNPIYNATGCPLNFNNP